MTILSGQNISKYFGAQDIFDGLSFGVHHGERIALVGPNGTGKSTLMKIISGQERPTDGAIHKAKTLRVGYLDQHSSLVSSPISLETLSLQAFDELRQQEAALEQMAQQLAETTDTDKHDQLLAEYGEAQHDFELAGGYEYEQTINLVLTGLGFKRSDYDTKLTKMSGGQQSRAQLARLLLERPDLLLLDEPTNHLDIASIEWLENYLQSWPGSIIAVAHDRYFLDNIATSVWELSFGSIERYTGNFSHYMTQRAERMARRQKEFEAQQAFIAKEEEFIRRNLAGQRTKEAQGRRKRLQRMERLGNVQEHKKVKLNIKTNLRSGDLVLATHDLRVGYPKQAVLFNCPDLEIRRGDCVALLGPNGSGKTTFVKTIMKDLPAQGGHIRFGTGVHVSYFAQTQADLNLENTILDEILSVKNLPIGEARTYLGRFLFSGEDVFKVVGTLSGGERSRVALAKLALTGSNFLILDEPTNHLDIASQENLEDVLANFDGTVLIVSHDRYFVDALADYTWALDPQAKNLAVTEGGYSAYLARREAEKTPKSSKVVQDSQRSREQTKAEQRAARQLTKQIEAVEAEIAQTEAELTQLTTDIDAASQAQDISRLQQLGIAYQTAEQRLDDLLTQWADLETQAEASASLV